MILPCLVCRSSYETEWNPRYQGHVPQVCSEACAAKYIRGFWWTPFALKEGQFKPYKGQIAGKRSSYETRFEEWLKKHKIDHSYEPYVVLLERSMWYIPDFGVGKFNGLFIETKGLWTPEGSGKYKTFKIMYPDVPIFIADTEFLRRINA